jgi:hypothetical protein
VFSEKDGLDLDSSWWYDRYCDVEVIDVDVIALLEKTT